MAILAAITGLRLASLAFFSLDLYPDEAQYWSWSRDLAFGYFSKPPVIAWAIAASTAVCGSGEGCIKIWVPLAYFVAALAIYGVGRRLYGAAVGFFAALAFITLPAVSFSAAIASTDPLLVMFWSLALYAVARLAQGEARRIVWWLALGVAVGFGLLSKYAMGFFLIGMVLWLALDGEARRRLELAGAGWRRPAAAAAVMAVIYLPNLAWNIHAEFVTFAHTGGNANLRGDLFHPVKLVEFIGAQFGVFGPVLFAALLLLMFRVGLWRADWRTRLFAALVLPMLLAISTVALLSRANANWVAPIYVAASVWVTAMLVLWDRRRLVLGSLALHVAVAAAVGFLVVSRHGPGVHAGITVPRGVDPYVHYDGWREIGVAVSDVRRRFPGVPVLVNDRKLLAELLYYVRPWPDDVYSWQPPQDRIGDHFDLTRPLLDVPDGQYLLVNAYDDPRGMLHYFRDFALVGDFTVPHAQNRVRHVWVFHVRGFLGYKAPRIFYEPNPIQPVKKQDRR